MSSSSPSRFARVVFSTLLWLLIAGLGCENLTAQIFNSGSGQVAGSNDHGQYTLTGTVVNSLTGEPISRALVQTFSGAQQSVFTAGDGSFHFEGLNAGTVMLNVRKPGFFNDSEISPARYRGKSVQVGPNTDPVVMKLVPEAIVYGRVVDADGEPMEGAQVQARTVVIMNGRKQQQQRRGGSTNEDGEFRIASLTPGPYYISVVPNRNPNRLAADRPKEQEMGYRSVVYWPNSSDLASAGQIELAPGQRVQMDFSLKREPVFRVSGFITGISPGQGGGVQMMEASGENTFFGGSGVDRQTGKFEMRSVPAGSYLVRAQWGDARGQLSAEVPATVASNIEDLRVVLQPAVSIPVNVETNFSRPTPQNTSFPHPENPLVMVNLRSPQAMRGGASSSFDGPPGNRTYALRNVNPGRYAVEFNPFGPWYVQSATCGTLDLLHDELVVASGGAMQPIEIVLRDDGATLSGSLNSDSPPDSYALLVVPDFAPMQSPKVIMSGGRRDFQNTGQFTVNGLAPGDYSVYAFDRVDGIEYANPEVMRKYSSQAAHASLTPNGKASVSVTLIHTGD